MIQRPRNEVAAYSSNPDNAPTWYVNIKSVEWKTQPPVKIGSHIAFVAHFLGRRMAYTYEVVELVPDERFVMRTAQGPFPMETTYSWEPTADGGTRMTLRNRGKPTAFPPWWLRSWREPSEGPIEKILQLSRRCWKTVTARHEKP